MCFACKYFLLLALITYLWRAQKIVPAKNLKRVPDSKAQNTGGLTKSRGQAPQEQGALSSRKWGIKKLHDEKEVVERREDFFCINLIWETI